MEGADKAQKDIEGTGKVAEKASETFAKVGTAIKDNFDGEKIQAFGVPFEKLNNSISGQQKRLDLLKQKYSDLYLTQGKTSDETQEVANEIEKLSAELKRNKNALNEAKDAADSFDQSIEEIAEDSKEINFNSIKDLAKSLIPIPQQFLKIAGAAGAFGTAVVGAVKAMVEITDGTREYRTEMGKLDAAFSASGHSADVASKTYSTLYSIIGETDQAVEAAQQISLLAKSEEDAAKWADLAAGVVGRFGDALQPETFFEAANETFSLNEATGAFVQMLEGCQMSVDEFNEGLQACVTTEEKQAYMLGVTKQALGQAGEAYKKNNKDIIAATAAQGKLEAATAKWGKTLEPIATTWKEIQAIFISGAADLLDPFGQAADSMVGTMETASDAAAKVEELRDQLRKLEELPPALWGEGEEHQRVALLMALDQAEAEYAELAEAEQLAAEKAEAAARAAADTSAEFATITEQYVADAMTLFETFASTYEGISDRVSSWFAPFEKASTSVWTNINLMMDGMQSQIDFNKKYSDNLKSLKDYGLGELSEAFQSYGANGAAYAQKIVEAVEKAGGATTEEGQKIIQGFADMYQQLVESQDELSNTMWLMNGDVEAAVDELVATYGIAIEDLDKSAEASAAAKNTFEAFLKSMNSKTPEILQAISSFGQQITTSLQNGMGSINITVTKSLYPSDTPPTLNIPGAKTGLDFVPYDDYLVYLHHGEAVLTKEEAAAWRAGKETASNGDSGSGVTVNQYIEAVAQTPVELASATAAYFEQARWVT